ncbi:MAG TPA: hypothetical protein VES73_14145 [Lamprocystis sp. (in: g-proteobacteria)]|nr:hypothetical protein [Lamprocystis sp. (in: g-proteobacteria)]
MNLDELLSTVASPILVRPTRRMTQANAHRQNNFGGILTNKIDFNKHDELPRDKFVYLINHFGSKTFDRAQVSDDLFGNA